MAVGLALLGVPVWVLTSPTPAGPPAVAVPTGPEKTSVYDVFVTASHPGHLGVRVANQPAIESPGAASSLAASFTMSTSKPEDLAVFGNFGPDAGSSALRVEVRHAGRTLADSTFWGTGLVEDVVNIPTP